jgi:hypothetical protein
MVFHNAGTLFFYLALDLVFVPFQVLLVTIIIEQLLNERDIYSLALRTNPFNPNASAVVGTVI